MKSLSLHHRIVLWTVGGPLAVVVVLLVLLSIVMRGAVTQASDRAAVRTNALLHDAVSRRIDELAGGAEFLAYLGVTRQVLGTHHRASLEEYLGEYRDKLHADWILGVDQDGKEVGCTSSGLFGQNADMRDRFKIDEALDGKAWRGVSAFDHRTFMAATTPLKVGQVVYGVIVVGLEIDSRFAQSIARQSGVQLVLYSGSKPIGQTISARAPEFKREEMLRIHDGGQPYVGKLSDLRDVDSPEPITFLALMKEAEVTDPFDRVRAALFAIAMLAIAAAIPFGARAARNVTAPIESLAESAQAIRRGEWPDAIDSRREDEIGVLERVFDEMTNSLRHNKQRLVSMLQLDPLTELMNHRTFRDRLTAKVAVSATTGDRLAVAMFDIDDFEKFNRKYGAEEGDRVLKEVADRLRVSFGLEVPLGRYGGNEFSVVLKNVDFHGAFEQARALIAIETPVTVSVGYATLEQDLDRADFLLLAAEMAVGQAKHAGRNRVRQFEGFDSSSGVDVATSLQRGSYAAIRALAEAVDAKDEYTRGHSQRVAEYAKRLAIALGYDDGFVELVFETGTLHDVGKIGVPDGVLKKTTRLNDEEFDFIRRHPEMGERIVSQIPQLRDSLPGIRHHHERWDGRGYPDALAGEEIPLIARVLALADTFDAMTSDRPYRPGMDEETALAEIERNAGTQFDPALVPAFCIAIRQGRREAA